MISFIFGRVTVSWPRWNQKRICFNAVRSTGVLPWMLVNLVAIVEATVELVTQPSSGWQSCFMPCLWFFYPLQFVRSLSFVQEENDNYLPLLLFPFLVSSGQSWYWTKFQRLFVLRIIPCWKWQNDREEIVNRFYFTRLNLFQRSNSRLSNRPGEI